MKPQFLLGLFAFGIVAGLALAAEPECETADEIIRHEDCTMYYQCSNFEPILSQCPGELYYNPGLGQCDFSWNVTDCIGGTNGPPSGSTMAPPTSSGPELTTEQQTFAPTTSKPTNPPPTEVTTKQPELSTPDSTSEPSPCPADGIVNVAFPGNCSLYYLCINGDGTVMSCAEGLLFNEDLGKCDLAENVDCKVPTPTQAPTTQSPTQRPTTEDSTSPVDCPAEGIVFLPDPKDCKKYYLCANGEAIPQECADGLLFDPILGKCAEASEVECNIKPECPAEGIVYLPLPNTCTEYLMCISGEGIEMECADGTEFDPEQNKCVLDENYECPFANLFKESIFSSEELWRK